jgi:hypothetical protein
MILLRRRRRRRACARTRSCASARVHLKIAAAGVSDRSVAAPRARFQNVYFKMVVAGLRREIVNVRFIFKSSRRRAATDPALPVGRSRSVCRYYTNRRPLKTRSTADKGLATRDFTEPTHDRSPYCCISKFYRVSAISAKCLQKVSRVPTDEAPKIL